MRFCESPVGIGWVGILDVYPPLLHPGKCKFMYKQVKYLGFKISEAGTEPSDEKTEVVKAFETPKTQKDIKAFLGLTGYFRRFIKDYAEIAAPLNGLLKKNEPFNWSKECQTSFETMKDKLVSSPILAFPDFTKPFELHTDASGVAIGSALMQRHQKERKE